MAHAWGGDSCWQQDDVVHPHEANYLKLDITKAMSRLGWTPRWGLPTALLKIIEWHHTWLSRGDIQAKCLQQILEYQSSSRIHSQQA
jgi:CDP-glucose 4,6-dehydratase